MQILNPDLAHTIGALCLWSLTAIHLRKWPTDAAKRRRIVQWLSGAALVFWSGGFIWYSLLNQTLFLQTSGQMIIIMLMWGVGLFLLGQHFSAWENVGLRSGFILLSLHAATAIALLWSVPVAPVLAPLWLWQWVGLMLVSLGQAALLWLCSLAVAAWLQQLRSREDNDKPRTKVNLERFLFWLSLFALGSGGGLLLLRSLWGWGLARSFDLWPIPVLLLLSAVLWLQLAAPGRNRLRWSLIMISYAASVPLFLFVGG